PMRYGAGLAPAGGRIVAMLTKATTAPIPRTTSGDGATSFTPRRPSAAPREVAVEGRGGRLRLALVLGAELRRPVRPIDGRAHLEERDLADLHPEVQRDRQVGDVRQLEGQVALPAGVDIPRCRVDEQSKPPEGALSLQAGHEIVRQLDPFERLAGDELAGVKEERT